MSIIQDPDIYEQFEKVILVHGCRQVGELAYQKRIAEELPNHEFLGELVSDRLLYYPTVTREPFENQGRIPDLLVSPQFYEKLGLPPLDIANDRFMLCGSPAMLKDTVEVLERFGLSEGNMSHPGHYVIERAFVDK
jgi:ferredoxin--NADP+ reductase